MISSLRYFFCISYGIKQLYMATSGLSNDSLGLCPCEAGQLSTIIPQTHGIWTPTPITVPCSHCACGVKMRLLKIKMKLTYYCSNVIFTFSYDVSFSQIYYQPQVYYQLISAYSQILGPSSFCVSQAFLLLSNPVACFRSLALQCSLLFCISCPTCLPVVW